MFSFFKAKQPKPFHRFEIYQDGNGEFGVQVNSRHELKFELDYANVSARSFFKLKRYPNVQQAEKDIDYIMRTEDKYLRQQQKTFVKTYP